MWRVCENKECKVLTYVLVLNGNLDHSCPSCGKIGNLPNN